LALHLCFLSWLVYLFAAILATLGHVIAYPLVMALSVLTLIVSLPQPEHFSFVRAGISVASLTFLIGSALQLAVLILIPVYLVKTRGLTREGGQA